MENSTLMEIPDEYVYSDLGYWLNSSLFDGRLDNIEIMTEDRIITMIIILSTVILISVIGNLVVVISVFYIRLRSLTVIFILNLALSDLLSPVGLMFYLFGNIWSLPIRDAACKVASFFHSTGFYSSIFFLALMIFQHYMAIVHSLSVWKKGRGFTIILICVWVLSVLAALPTMVHSVTSHTYMYSRTAALVAFTYRENIVFVCAFLFMDFCYIRILQTVLKSPTNQNKKHRTTGLAFILVAVFFICCAPCNIMIFMYTLIYQIWPLNLDHFFYALYICALLAFNRCCLNPVIYGLFGVKFHKTERYFAKTSYFQEPEVKNIIPTVSISQSRDDFIDTCTSN